MMLYKNTKAMVHSPEGDTDFLGIVTGVLLGDTFVLYFLLSAKTTSNINKSDKK